MGFGPFSGQTYYATQLTTVPLFPDPPQNLFGVAIAGAIVGNRELLGEALIRNLDSPKLQLKNYYEEGRDNFINGLPTTNMLDSGSDNTKVLAVLVSLYGSGVTLLSSIITPMGRYTWQQYLLQNNDSNYDYPSNKITVNNIVWDFVGIIGQGATYHAELRRNVPGFFSGPDNDVWNYPVTQYSQYGSFSSDPASGLWYTAVFTHNGVKKIWIYHQQTNTYPTLNVSINFSANDTYPIVPIRQNDVNVYDTPTSALYLSCKALLKKSRANFDDISVAVLKQPDANGNLVPLENLEFVSDIFYLFGINIYGQTPQEKKVLYKLFTTLKETASYDATNFNLTSTVPFTSNNFTLTSGNYNFEIKYNFITSVAHSGVIAAVGECTSEIVYVGQATHTYVQADENGNNNRTSGVSTTYSNSVLVLQKQTTSSGYIELRVSGLHLSHYISIINDVSYLKTDIFIEPYTVGQTLTATQASFLIPLSYSDLSSLTIRDIEKITPLCTHIQIYASQSQYVAWYQTGFFGDIITLAAIVMLFYDPTGTSTTTLYALVTTVLINFAITIALKWLFEEFVGNDLATALLTAYAVYAMVSFGLNGSEGFTTLPMATQMMQITNALSTTFTIKTSVEMEALKNEMELFNEQLAVIEAELDTLEDFLSVNNADELGYISSALRNTTEPAEDYYNRTLIADPGALVFDQLDRYYETNLDFDKVYI